MVETGPCEARAFESFVVEMFFLLVSMLCCWWRCCRCCYSVFLCNLVSF